MRRFTFVIPKSSWRFEELLHPPLGVGYLAAVLLERDYQVSIVDGQILEKEGFYRELKENQSEVVGISITAAHLSESLEVARVVKNNSPQTTVILGGPGVNLIEPRKFLANNLDIIVRGEAEEVLPQLLEKIEKGLSLETIPNLVYKANGEIVFTKIQAAPSNLDRFSFPAREMFDLEAYFDKGEKRFGIKSLGVITSRGCPHGCIFCDKSVSGYKFRARSAKNIVGELEVLKKRYPFLDKIFIQDDSFATDRKRVLEICREIQARHMRVRWNALSRVDDVDEKMLREMKKAGCEELDFGVESGSERLLRWLNKGVKISQIIKAFDLCHEIGIKPGASLIVGIPGEKEEDIEATIKLIQRIRPHFLGISYLTPFPNTALYRQTKQWISIKDLTDWERIEGSVYRYPFEIEPKEAYNRIYDAFEEIKGG